MKNFKWSLLAQILGVFGLLFVIASVIFPVFRRARENEHPQSCQSNLKQIGLGFLQYVQDYDDKMPLSATSAESYGWANALQPYLKSTWLFQCPTAPNQGPQIFRLTGYTDYFYNAQLQNRNWGTIGDVTSLIMVADGNDGYENTDARYAKTAIPAAWRTDSNSPSFRHLGTANYLFVDGHVKGLKVEQISTNWSRDKFFFQPKK